MYLHEELALTGLDYEGTIKIKSDKIDTIRDNNTLTSDEIQICFDEDEISKKLEELIASLHYKTLYFFNINDINIRRSCCYE